MVRFAGSFFRAVLLSAHHVLLEHLLLHFLWRIFPHAHIILFAEFSFYMDAFSIYSSNESLPLSNLCLIFPTELNIKLLLLADC